MSRWLLFSYFLLPINHVWSADHCKESFSKISKAKERSQPKDKEWVPTNQPSARHAGSPDVPQRTPELPGFVAKGSKFVRRGIAFGPNEKFQAAFNPTAFVAKDKDGVEKVFMVIRGEEERPHAEWKRRSLPYLASSEDGVHFKMLKDEPLFEPSDWFDKLGGIEDPRYADLRLQPFVDPVDGKSFDGAIFYTGFDGKTARVGAVLFNHDNLNEFRKTGTLFSDSDISKNPLVPDNPAWNKSPAMLQYRDPKTKKFRNILYIGEGNLHHGGIMALEADQPFQWKWPANKAPSIKARKGFYDQNLVEPAFAPVIAPLPANLANKTGQTHGIYLCLHGDAPPKGYQVGYRIFRLDDPTGNPIFESSGPFLWPQEKYEIEGQVGKVVFASGSVEFKNQRFIYYGAADKYIGVASAPAN